MKKIYYSMNINGLKVQNLNPIKFEHIIMKKNVAFYQTGMLGRFLTVEDKNPTNTLEEAQDWLISIAQKQQNLDSIGEEIVPYIDMSTLRPLNQEEVKTLNIKRRFTFHSKNTK